MSLRISFFTFLLVLLRIKTAQGSDSVGRDSGKPLPRLACIKHNNASAKSGPSRQHPTLWVYTKRAEPVQIVAEFEHWRQIKDLAGDKSWMHKSSLSKGKYTVIKSSEGGAKMYRVPTFTDDKGKIKHRNFAYVMNDVRCQLLRCRDGWCKIECGGTKGWTQQSYCWGADYAP